MPCTGDAPWILLVRSCFCPSAKNETLEFREEQHNLYDEVVYQKSTKGRARSKIAEGFQAQRRGMERMRLITVNEQEELP